MIYTPTFREPEAIRPRKPVELLTSAARTTTTSTPYYDAPRWARGVHAMLSVSAVPGVDTVTFRLMAGWEFLTTNYLVTSASTAVAGQTLIYLGPDAAPPYYGSSTVGSLWPRMALNVLHSGGGSFTYRAFLMWTP